MRIDLDQVPLREADMTAYEILLSESQERMLVVVRKGEEARIRAICEKWDLNVATIGTVTPGGSLVVHKEGQKEVEIPAESLVLGGGAPVYRREERKPDYLEELHAFDFQTLPEPSDYNEVLKRLLGSPNIASKQWVFQQYDHMVRSNTVVLPGSDAAVIRIKGTNRALAVKTDGNARYVYLNPRVGAQIAVAESARNVVCSGGRPVAITNCLNFGNPYKPEIYYQFAEAVRGIGDACRALETPVTGGNVSFYNENPDGAVYPTPVIGMLGLVEDLRHVTTCWFKEVNDVIVLLGTNTGEIGGSEYLKLQHNLVAGNCPQLNLEFEVRLQRTCLEAIRAGWVRSAHDVSDGGLAVALAECCVLGPRALGAELEVEAKGRRDFLLFGEDQSRIVLSVAPDHLARVQALCAQNDVPMQVLGKVGGDRLVVNRGEVDVSVVELKTVYFEAIRSRMEI